MNETDLRSRRRIQGHLLLVSLVLILILAAGHQWRATSVQAAPTNMATPGLSAAQPASADRGQLSPEEAAIPPSFTDARSDTARYRTLDWTDLMPPDDLVVFRDQLFEHDEESAQAAAQFGSFKTVAALDGVEMRLPGYAVPVELDDQGQMREFFFVPYFGACLHVPPPPPNQLLHVRLSEAQVPPDLWEAQWLMGTLRVRRHDDPMASAAYSVDGGALAPYDG